MTIIKNIAIIAHVDHGKTTLVDKILHHCNLFHSNQNTGDLILDNNDLERERGITILSKNVSVEYNGVKICVFLIDSNKSIFLYLYILLVLFFNILINNIFLIKNYFCSIFVLFLFYFIF